ncbi:MAG: hypothetical protein KGH57_02875 [Candidatus Micrarchaeota archaeon]|nr:hypothetical protein [Candidatus Micrarchaeota archaeon]
MPAKTIPANRVQKADFSLNRKDDGRLEVVCKHQINHTIWAPREMGSDGLLHGCDGCCGTDGFKKYVRGLKIKRLSWPEAR